MRQIQRNLVGWPRYRKRRLILDNTGPLLTCRPFGYSLKHIGNESNTAVRHLEQSTSRTAPAHWMPLSHKKKKRSQKITMLRTTFSGVTKHSTIFGFPQLPVRGSPTNSCLTELAHYIPIPGQKAGSLPAVKLHAWSTRNWNDTAVPTAGMPPQPKAS